MAAIVGTAGLAPTMAALEAGRDVALANKEALVSSGELMTAAARASGATTLPVANEHTAIFHCLAVGGSVHGRLTHLPASGDPLPPLPASQMRTLTPAQALPA